MVKLRQFLFVLFFLALGLVQSQEIGRAIKGRVYGQDGDVAATHVLNITTKKAAIADAEGFFEIAARLHDTLHFTAVHYKKVVLVVNLDLLKQKLLHVPMETALTELDEVIVLPYNLTGHLDRDAKKIKINEVITAATEELPNADAPRLTQSERKLYTARSWEYTGNKLELDPLINYFSGRTKMLKERVSRDNQEALLNTVRGYYADSIYSGILSISVDKIDAFWQYCEADPNFGQIAASDDQLFIWEWLVPKAQGFHAAAKEAKD